MSHPGDYFNILLGLCALAYSWVPAERIRNYKRSVALSLRIVGALLVVISATNLLLDFGHHR